MGVNAGAVGSVGAGVGVTSDGVSAGVGDIGAGGFGVQPNITISIRTDTIK